MESEEIKKMVSFLYYFGCRKQVISKNGFNFDLVDVKCGVYKAPYYDLFCFLSILMICIWESNSPDVHYSEDNINPLKFNSCVKSIKKQIKYDLKILKASKWLKASKFSLMLIKLILFFLLLLNSNQTVK